MFNWLKRKMILVRESQSKYRGIKVPCRQSVFSFCPRFSNRSFSLSAPLHSLEHGISRAGL